MDYLDFLSRELRCEYLSDLHFYTITPEQAEMLLKLDADMFSRQEYERAARYLLGDGAHFSTGSEARAAVVARLLKHK